MQPYCRLRARDSQALSQGAMAADVARKETSLLVKLEQEKVGTSDRKVAIMAEGWARLGPETTSPGHRGLLQ